MPRSRWRIRRWVYLSLLVLAPLLYFSDATRMKFMLGDGDAFVQYLPYWQYAAEEWRRLTPPLWTPYIFSGYPLLAEPQAGIFNPLRLLFLVLSPLAAMNLTVLVHYLLAGLFTFLLAEAEGLTLEAALFAGLSFQFCGFLLGHQAVTPLFATASLFPVLFYLFRLTLRQSSYRAISGGVVAILALVLSGHTQFTFYAVFFSSFYAAYLLRWGAPPAQRRQFLTCVGVIYGLGAGVSAFQLFPTLELMLHSTRRALTYDDFVGWGWSPSPPALFMSLLSTRLAHLVFPNITSEAMFDVGWVILMLAALAVVLARRPAAFWIVLVVLALLLCLGGYTPLYRIMFWLPGYNLFRIAARNGIALDFALIMLAAHGLAALQRRLHRLPPTRAAVIAAIALLVAYVSIHQMEPRLAATLWRAHLPPALHVTLDAARADLLPASLQAAAMGAGAGVVLLLLLKLGGGRAVSVLCMILAMMHFWEYRGWVFWAPKDQIQTALHQRILLPDAHRDDIALARGTARIAAIASCSWLAYRQENRQHWHAQYAAAGGVNLTMLQRVPSVSGYSPLILRDYQRFSGGMEVFGGIPDLRFFSSPRLNLLNVSYVFAPAPCRGFPPAFLARLEPVLTSPDLTVYRNPRAPGLFWGVKRVRSVSEPQFWAHLDQETQDFANTAVLVGGHRPELTARTFGLPENVEAHYVTGNRITITVETPNDAFLASSHPSYPGWFAWVDGARTDLLRVNGLFVGLAVPRGTHTIVLRFIPLSFWAGILTAMISVGALAIAARRDLLRLR